MRKTEIDSILLVNLYFTSCKIVNPKSRITDLLGRYLSKKITKALIANTDIKNNNRISNKILVLSSSFFIYLVGL